MFVWSKQFSGADVCPGLMRSGLCTAIISVLARAAWGDSDIWGRTRLSTAVLPSTAADYGEFLRRRRAESGFTGNRLPHNNFLEAGQSSDSADEIAGYVQLTSQTLKFVNARCCVSAWLIDSSLIMEYHQRFNQEGDGEKQINTSLT